MIKNCIAASALALVVFTTPAVAQSCAYEQKGWSAAKAKREKPARAFAETVTLVSIGLHDDGSFKISTASKPAAGPKFAWMMDDLVDALEPADTTGKSSPLDMAMTRDTQLIFRLEPAAWAWETKSNKMFFLKKTNSKGRKQRHNPFSKAKTVPGHADMISVRYPANPAYRGCNYTFNLGAIVRQTASGRVMETPLIIDPDIKNGDDD